MNSLKQFIPYQCVSRLPRSPCEVDRCKAIEYRLFLLYIGNILLHDVMSSVYRYHFLVLNMAISLLLSDNSASNINLTEFLGEWRLCGKLVIPKIYNSALHAFEETIDENWMIVFLKQLLNTYNHRLYYDSIYIFAFTLFNIV